MAGRFTKGTPKPPNSGRKKGVQNKITQTLEQRCAEAGCDPLQALLECMQMPEYKFLAAKELMQYVYPKRSAILVHQPFHDERVALEISETVKREGLLEGKEEV